MDFFLTILHELAWPGVGLVLGIVALVLLKTALIRLVDRVKKIGPTELSTGSSIQESAKDLRPTPSDEAFKVFDNRLLVKREEAVRKDLDARGISTPIERERVLIRYFSAVSLGYQFERTYNQIWGSQIAALQLLNTRGDHGCERSELLAFYSEGKNGFPLLYANYSFESWLKFMESFLLITVASDKISVTLEGREFLKYLLDQSYLFQKAG